ncbi:MAG: hypothetical protein ABIL58_03905 [Pseudomonadota bacterium]
MPDNAPDIDFISIEDLITQDQKAAEPEPSGARRPLQMPLPQVSHSPAPAASKPRKQLSARPANLNVAVPSKSAAKRRQTIVGRRRKRGANEAVLAASMGVFLIVMAVGVYLYFAPSLPAPAPVPVFQGPRVFKIPPLPVPAAAPVSPQTDDIAAAPSQAHEPIAAAPPLIDLEREVSDFLSSWRLAWEKTAGLEGALGPYLDCYAATFTHEGMDKAAWATDKGRKNRRKDWIRVRLSDIRVATPMAGEPVRVTFFQDYASSNYSEAAEKTLLLKKSGSSWQIIGIQ